MGIEPTQSAWKAEILPLNYTRIWPRTFIIILVINIFVNSFFKKIFINLKFLFADIIIARFRVRRITL